MKNATGLLILLTLLSLENLSSQIRITYLDLQNQEIKIKNLGDTAVNVSAFSLCQNATSILLDTSATDLVIISGSDFDSIPSNGFVLFTWPELDSAIGDIWISEVHNFCDDTSLFVDYVQYGDSAQYRESQAVEISAWMQGTYLQNDTLKWGFVGGLNDRGRQFWQPYSSIICNNFAVDTVLVERPLCIGSSDGSIEIEVSNGSGFYTYSWSSNGDCPINNPTGQNISQLYSCLYTVEVTDTVYGCTANMTVSLSAPQPLEIVSINLSVYEGGFNVSCNGANDGSLEAFVIGGTPDANQFAPFLYSYDWTGEDYFEFCGSSFDPADYGNPPNTSFINNIPAGTLTLTVTDVNGCFVTTCVNLTEPEPLSSTGSTTAVDCNNLSGCIIPNVNGGSGNYISYEWTGGIGSNSPAADTLCGLDPGQYSLTVTDTNNCQASFEYILLESIVHFNDTVFKALLLENTQINTNSDNEIQYCEAAAYSLAIDVTNINNTAPYISDLTGIEAFTNIISLSFVNQEVSFLDLSHNQKLEVINGFDNQLTNLILGSNDSLNELNCQNNLLSSLDVSGCASIRQILCDFNPIEQLNLTNNPLLEILECNNSTLTTLDLTQNTQLTSVICNNTAIEQIQLPATGTLHKILCNSANLQSLDLTAVILLDTLNCTNNPDLPCIQVLNVDAADAEVNWFIDGSASYSVSCAFGCNDSVACNYDSLAGINDGSCIYAACLDSAACNYDALAICSDTSLCVFLPINSILDCEGTCVNDDDLDGICNELEAGCTDSTACNYSANGDTSITCYYPGCTNIFACNYSSAAACNDGSCTFDGCTDSTACNFNPFAGCDDGSCLPSGCNIVGACNYVPFFCNNNTCVFPGCTDTTACNYQSQAGCDNGSCNYLGCTSMTACNYDPLAGCDDNSCVFPGCTDSLASNFEATAGCDDGSCTYPGCNIVGACNYDSLAGSNDNSCVFPGCSNPAACNYDSLAGCDDGSCVLGYCCTNPSAVNYLFPSNDSAVVCLYAPVIFLYHDANGDSTYNNDELGLPNRPVLIQTNSEDLLVYTNGLGYVQYLTAANDSIHVSLSFPAGDNWTGPTDTFTIDYADSLYLPLVLNGSGEMQFTPFTGFPSGLDCNLGYHGGVVVYNGLNEAVGVTMSLDVSQLIALGFEPTMDNPFETESYFNQIDSTLIWLSSVLQPGQMRILTFNLLGPGTVSPGDSIALNYTISYTTQSNGTVNEFIVHWVEQTCLDEASDIGIIPSPVGLYEPHYVLNGTEITFFINFAYDGNPERSDSCAAGATAYRVLTSDTVDGFSMELSSIQPIANSYPSLCSVTVEEIEEGRAVINFDFTGVNLRADTVDGYNAGYAMFSAQLLDTLAQGWVVNNQATTEFFDSTGCTCDYVYTDSTLHTIFGCEFNVPSVLQLCEGPEATLDASDPYANYYQWTIDSSSPLLSPEFSFVDVAPGNYAMQLITGNELCLDTNQFELLLAETPQLINVIGDIEACEGDSVSLAIETADATDQIVWSGDIINGESFAAVASQEYTATVENEFGCTVHDTVQLIVNPIPSGAIEVVGNTYTAPDGSSWQWYLNGVIIDGANSQVFMADSTTQGEISVLVTSALGCENVIVNVTEWGMNDGFKIFPNPMRDGATLILPEGIFTLTLYDMSGRIIRSAQGCRSRFTIERGSLSPGHYTLHIRDISRNVVMKLAVE